MASSNDEINLKKIQSLGMKLGISRVQWHFTMEGFGIFGHVRV